MKTVYMHFTYSTGSDTYVKFVDFASCARFVQKVHEALENYMISSEPFEEVELDKYELVEN